MAPPVLTLRDTRVDVGGSPAIDGLSFTTTGDHVIVLGAARALFEAASGARPVAHGELLIRGEKAAHALSRGLVAGAWADPAMPPAWTVRQYVTWSARLAGHARRAASSLAAHAMERLKMEPLAEAKLGRTAANARRATVIAAAMATGATTILLEDPLYALPEEAARNLARLVTHALEDRAWVVFAGRMPLVSPFALEADEAILVSGAAVAAQGAPAEIASRERTFSLRVYGEAAAFTRLAVSRGAVVQGASASGRAGAQMTMDLGELTTADLMATAAQANAVIVELSPLTRSFA